MAVLDNKGFDLWADGYDASVQLSDADNSYPFAGYKDVLAGVYAQVRALGKGKLLDIGFGTGVLMKKLYDDGYQVTGIDFSERMLAHARAKMPEANLVLADFAKGLPEEIVQERYDVITSTYALHHVPDAEKVALLKSLFGLLNPGGVLIIGDVAFETPVAQAALRAQCGDEWDADEYYFNYSEMKPLVAAPSSYVQVSACAGILTIKKPRMVLFDFGGTLTQTETGFDSIAGHRALLRHATANRDGLTLDEMDSFIQQHFNALDAVRLENHVEIHQHPFQRFTEEYLGLAFDIPAVERELIVWDGATGEHTPAPGMPELLAHLHGEGIRTGVISNIMYSGEALTRMIDRVLPGHHFEFIIATSEYVYRKPNSLIFELALRKACIDAADVWYMGDNFVCDVQGAAGVGIAPVWYTKTPDGREGQVPTCTVIGDWAQLTAWFGADTIGN